MKILRLDLWHNMALTLLHNYKDYEILVREETHRTTTFVTIKAMFEKEVVS